MLAQFVGERRLARTGRRRDDEDDSAHSRFCTCSRAFSISDFMARPSSVMRSASPATPVVFDNRVLASRFISCSRKSSFLPTSPPPSSSEQKVLDVVLHAHQFFLNVAALGQHGGFLQDAVGVGVRAQQLLHAAVYLFVIGLQDLAAQLFDFDAWR